MKQLRIWPAKPENSRWTDEQWAAITADGSNLLVAAAAGSGKTAVLVERIISRIADESRPLDVDAMLVATFTKAAAAEMKERIRHALEESLEKNPDSRHLRRQIALLPRASVTTLHSFCLEIVERYAPLIELDPGFRMANETEAELLRMDTLDELFEERYEAEGEAGPLAALADHFGGERSDEPLHRLVLELFEYAGSHPWPEHWLRKTAGEFERAEAETLLNSLWVKSLREDAVLLLQGTLHLLRSALRIAHEPGGPEPYIDTLFADIDGLDRIARAFDDGVWEDWQAAVADISFGRLKPCKGDEYDPLLIERVKGLRDAAKKAAGKLSEEWLVRSPEQYASELRALATAMEQLAELAVQFGERYEQAKRAKGLLDFSDLEHYALRILRDSSSTPEGSFPSLAALGFKDRFAEIYLDEYQDTNEVQEAIVSLISRKEPGNVFMVGDVKQSIYRFRLAEPGLFLEKYKTYEAYSGSADPEDASSFTADEDGLRIDLARNFRSRREILNAVNHVFRLIMREPVGEMNYDERAELIYGDGYPDAGEPNPYSVELIVLDSAPVAASEGDAAQGADITEAGAAEVNENGSAPAEEAEDAESAQLEARCIAAEIRKLMGSDEEDRLPFAVYDGKAKLHRPVQFRDIVILLRAVSALAPAFLDELKAAGIPAYADLATGYFAATEVDILLSLLSIIDNPHQDIPLAGVLRSPIGGFTAEQLARIRLARRGGSFWEAVNVAAKGNEDGADSVSAGELQEAIAKFVSKLGEWRNFARREPLGDLLWMLYRETGYYDYVGGLPGGGQRQANLRALVHRAVQYERSSKFRGLFRFLRFLGRMRDTGADLGAARALGESENVVRIVSIHRSKGLEFPVVFAAGLGRNFNRRDLNGAFLKHKKLGFGPRVMEKETRVAYPTLPQLAIRRKLAAEMLAEEMRVLYVALTRPKEKLYLIGTSKDAVKTWEQWSETAAMADGSLPTFAVGAASKYLDWLGPAAVIASEFADPARRWNCRIVPAISYTRQSTELQESNPDEARLWNAVLNGEKVGAGKSDASERINRMLSWEYHEIAATQVAAKTSITALKSRINASQPSIVEPPVAYEDELQLHEQQERSSAEGWTETDPQFGGSSVNPVVLPAATYRLRRPRFMSAKHLTPAERGTAFHLVMQHLPIEAGTTERRVHDLLESLTERRILSAAQREGVEASVIAAFCETPLYSRLGKALQVWREVPFTYGLDAASVYSGSIEPSAEETVIIQGVIDCLFSEEDGLVLVDYKTDALKGADAADAAEKHRFQVEQYCEAVQSILGTKVKEAYVYFFDGGQTIRLL
ncbi:helicase-exonuclease AddAB subunit AddA [Cohnella herbarum]|uniref:ATP-dependent helicase/nuclease subunit A n=1 Tax=Cohnella herbarum TaxID=2728023 RepID=A0A7Z2VIV2_9BACL|nr:helicase-exonuclease AddAB subunit AddA [Cohnella herbarum]QJD83655.1 helicase-exonuclease AddAB subunit AddA [Cohnella herbarum]